VFRNWLVCGVAREMEVGQWGGVRERTDEQRAGSLGVLKELTAHGEGGAGARVIGGVPEPVPALPPPSRKARRKVRRSDPDSGLAARVVGTDSADRLRSTRTPSLINRLFGNR